jgi:hypothetical protein
MATRPQILAAAIVVWMASTAPAQQYGPMGGPNYGPAMSPPPQMMGTSTQTPFVAQSGSPAFYGTPPGMEQSGIQLATASLPVGPASPAPSAAAVSVPPNVVYTDPNPNGVYSQGAPAEMGMTYGTAPQMAPGYPPPVTGPGAPGSYGSFPMPEPVAPRWYLRGEVVWLSRNSPNDRNLTSYDNASNSTDRLNNRFILDTDGLPFGLAPGMRVTVGHYLTDQTAIEGAYYGANNWDQRTGTLDYPSANGQGPLSAYWGTGGGPFSTSAFSNSNQQIADYHSSFESAEINVRQWVLPSMSVLAGFRYINVADQFQLTATNDGTNVDAGQVGYYRTWTNNNLGGFQFGTEYTHDLYARWLFFSAEGKAGAFLNWADQKNLLFNTGTTYDQRSSRETQFAGMFDFSASLSALIGSHLTLRGGYTFLFLDGLALASDQLDTNPTMASARNFLANKGSVVLQGPFVGAELAW